jgi:hypothetical protein
MLSHGRLVALQYSAPVSLSRKPIRAPVQSAKPLTREPKRHHTGRNIQLNERAPILSSRSYALADRNGWFLGETFERAVTALERDPAN